VNEEALAHCGGCCAERKKERKKICLRSNINTPSSPKLRHQTPLPPSLKIYTKKATVINLKDEIKYPYIKKQLD